MKVKKIEEHINWSGRKGFTFWNDGFEVNWVVITHKGEILARRTVVDGRNYERIEYYEVPRKRATDVYDEIVIDFVEICYENFGMECDGQPFCDFAGPEDCDLCELLDVFGVGYGTFLNDVFFQHRVMIEVDGKVGSDDCRCERKPMTEDEHTAKKVVSHIGNLEAMIEFADGTTAQWKFVVAHGELWYGRVGTEFIGGPYIILEEDYGRMKLNDVDRASALRDKILSDLNGDRRAIIAYDVDDEIMKLLNFCEDDFDSE